MLILLLVLITVAGVLLGRWLLGRWFNHLSVYSFIWGSVLVGVESNLIHYNEISGLAWFYVFSAWLCLYLGSGTVLLLARKRTPIHREHDGFRIERLRSVIWLFVGIAAIGFATQVHAVIREFGSLWAAIFLQGNDLYHARVDHPELGLAGASYVGVFGPAACALAGIYSARVAKLTLAGLMPLVFVVLTGVLMMGRATMILAIIWFAAAFLYTPRQKFDVKKWQAGVALGLAVLILVAGIGLISGTRGLAVNYYSVSPGMESASGYLPLLPPLFFYCTGPVVGFSDYLEHQDRNPHAFWGMYTFAPIYRGVSHFGLNTDVPFYEENHYTPTDINVLTYLKNVHSDFGPIGVLLFPYLLGASMTWLKLKLDEKFNPFYVVLLANGYLIVCFSAEYNPMFLGIWYFSLVLGFVATYWSARPVSQRQSVPFQVMAHD